MRVNGAGGAGLVVDIFAPVGKAGLGFLLVHGLASNARMWDGVARVLAQSGVACATVDLRGHGRSDKPDAGYDYDTMCADLEAVMTELRAAGGVDTVVPVGQSFGGNLVIELAARRPAGLGGVACVDGGVIDLRARFATFEEAEAVLTPPAIAGMPAADLETRLRAMHPDWPEAGIAGAMANFEVLPDGTVAPWLTLPRHLAILRTMWSASPRDAYPRIEVPVLLMPVESPPAESAGGKDGVAGGKAANWARDKRAAVEEAVALLSDVEVRWFSPADHDVHAQHPREVAGALLERFSVP